MRYDAYRGSHYSLVAITSLASCMKLLLPYNLNTDLPALATITMVPPRA